MNQRPSNQNKQVKEILTKVKGSHSSIVPEPNASISQQEQCKLDATQLRIIQALPIKSSIEDNNKNKGISSLSSRTKSKKKQLYNKEVIESIDLTQDNYCTIEIDDIISIESDNDAIKTPRKLNYKDNQNTKVDEKPSKASSQESYQCFLQRKTNNNNIKLNCNDKGLKVAIKVNTPSPVKNDTDTNYLNFSYQTNKKSKYISSNNPYLTPKKNNTTYQTFQCNQCSNSYTAIKQNFRSFCPQCETDYPIKKSPDIIIKKVYFGN